jgi:hypothetical protein
MSEQWKGLHYHDRHVTAAPFGWKKRALAAEAQVQAVREAVAYAERNYDAPIVTIGAIKIALDGGDA